MRRGNQRERAMIAGGAPMDCDHPFTAQQTAKMTKRADVARVPLRAATPSIPIVKFISTEITRPVAMKRLMFELSARNPFTSLPRAYAQ